MPVAGSRWTVAAWLEHWLENIARPTIRHNSYDAYRIAVRNHLIPGVGAHRLDRLAPEHLERLYRRMIEAGARPGTAHQVHRTARTALGEAVRRSYVQRNAAALARSPRLEVEPIKPYSLDEVQLILSAARSRRNGARWAIALALGLRQGEVLGLQWPDVDLDRPSSASAKAERGRDISMAAQCPAVARLAAVLIGCAPMMTVGQPSLSPAAV